MTKRLFMLLLLLPVHAFLASSQTFTLSGVVRDSASHSPLPAANLRVLGSSKGTVANVMGVYKLSLDQGVYTIVTSFIGYRSDTARIALNRPVEYNPRLQATTIELPEVVITSEDPAMAIMRKVLEYKRKWSDSLRTYEFDAFTRMVVRRDTAIAMIVESYVTGFWQKGDTLREFVKQKRHTENIPGMGNLGVGGTVINFYDDDVQFVGYRFVGPTSPDAFDYYEFKLEKTRVRDDKPVYTIRITPKSRIAPLFTGTLDVVGDVYALVGVNISPNEAFTIPFVSGINIRYSQQFGLYEGRFWMPMDVRLNGSFEIGLAGFSFPRVVLEQSSVLYDYRINRPLADSIFKMKHLTELPSAKKLDSTFWQQHDVLPLTREEQHAYRTLDSTQTMDKQFKPSGPLSALSSPIFDYLSHLDVRFDRVEGLFLGIEYSRDSVMSNRLSMSGSVGYGFSDKKVDASVGATLALDKGRKWKVGVEAHDGIDYIPDDGYYPSAAIALAAVLSKTDYRDYFYSKGWRAFLASKPYRRLSLDFEYRNEDQSTAAKRTDFSLFEKNTPFRGNPTISDGVMRSLGMKIRYGDDPIPFGLAGSNFAEVEVQRADHGFLSSTFDFTRYQFHGEMRFNTYSSRLLFPPVLNFKIAGGVVTGTVPVQQFFSLESRYDGVAPLGVLRAGSVKEFAGNRYVMVTAEHNFRSTPFLLLKIPYLYRNSIELILYGSAAQTWSSNPLPFGTTTNGWYSEAGVGISRILTFFRFDFTYRFTQPKGLFVTLGVAQLI